MVASRAHRNHAACAAGLCARGLCPRLVCVRGHRCGIVPEAFLAELPEPEQGSGPTLEERKEAAEKALRHAQAENQETLAKLREEGRKLEAEKAAKAEVERAEQEKVAMLEAASRREVTSAMLGRTPTLSGSSVVWMRPGPCWGGLQPSLHSWTVLWM